ncbi:MULTISPECIES: ComF family protein [unclassified Bartonella]|uniref:ComF family protein n=1 Tax=unclassified Bartonella TaxID=2645622 RepID=UPI001EF0A894|nr:MULTISPECIES: ComF family protein [unclassified Bartonella]
MNKLIKRLITILYPPICYGCAKIVSDYGIICPGCWKDLQFITKPYCPIMGTPFAYDMGEGFLSGEAIQNPPPFSSLRSAVVHKGLARTLAKQLKYGDRLELVSFMANSMILAGHEIINDCDFIIPIPLHFRRFFVRRYNQSAELARYIAEKKKKPFKPGWLVRYRHTRPQVGLYAKERKMNMQNAFKVPSEVKTHLKGRSILLVDDVLTTGVTVTVAAKTLKHAGAQKVNVLTFSRVLKDNFTLPYYWEFI